MRYNITNILHHQRAQNTNYNEIYKNEQYKRYSRVATWNFGSQARGARRKGPQISTADPLSYRYATLKNRKSSVAQAPRSEYIDPGE